MLTTAILPTRLIPLAALTLACLAPAQNVVPLENQKSLEETAEAARGALLSIESPRPGLGVDHSIVYRGFFISADGLAVVPLRAFDGGKFSVRRESDDQPVSITGVVAAQATSGIGVVRTGQPAPAFLSLAPKDIPVGERVAILRDQENGGTLTAPVLARRMAPVARSQQYVEMLSIGANLGVRGGLHVPAGTPLFNARGQVVGLLSTPRITSRQRFLLAFPSFPLGAQLARLSPDQATIPFPLPQSLRPADPLAHDATYLRGRNAQMSGDHLEAERLRRKALAQQPGSAAAWQRLGFVLRDLGRNEDAMDAFQMAIEHGNNLGTFILNRADQLLLNGRLDEATGALQSACKAKPFDYNLHRAYAGALRLKKDEAGAARQLRIASELAPDAITVWENLSKCLAAQGNWDEEKIASNRIYELESLYRPR